MSETLFKNAGGGTSFPIDGGTASNTQRITIPKNTTTNLNALTRKQATIVYDTTLNAVKYDDGSQLVMLLTTNSAPDPSLKVYLYNRF